MRRDVYWQPSKGVKSYRERRSFNSLDFLGTGLITDALHVLCTVQVCSKNWTSSNQPSKSHQICVVLWNLSTPQNFILNLFNKVWLANWKKTLKLSSQCPDIKGRYMFIQKKYIQTCPPLCGVIALNITCFLGGNHYWDDDGYNDEVIAHTVPFIFGQLIFSIKGEAWSMSYKDIKLKQVLHARKHKNCAALTLFYTINKLLLNLLEYIG